MSYVVGRRGGNYLILVLSFTYTDDAEAFLCGVEWTYAIDQRGYTFSTLGAAQEFAWKLALFKPQLIGMIEVFPSQQTTCHVVNMKVQPIF